MRSLCDEHSTARFAYLARRVGRDVAEQLQADTLRASIQSYPTFDPSRRPWGWSGRARSVVEAALTPVKRWRRVQSEIRNQPP